MVILKTHWRSLTVALILTISGVFPLAFCVWIVFWLGVDHFVEMVNTLGENS